LKVYPNLENGVKVGNAGARELDEGENAQYPGYGEQADHQQHAHCYFAAKTENGDLVFRTRVPFSPFPNFKLKVYSWYSVSRFLKQIFCFIKLLLQSFVIRIWISLNFFQKLGKVLQTNGSSDRVNDTDERCPMPPILSKRQKQTINCAEKPVKNSAITSSQISFKTYKFA
jgi:hypothetical protein